MSTPESGRDAEQPVVAVLRGNPTDGEIAAIVVALQAAAASAAPAPPDRRPPELWGPPTALHRGAQPFAPNSYSAFSSLSFVASGFGGG
ncbi:acyl-CoA carboxylase epsilon subunit [Skermania piniformis]|uniref:Acyl-CoA carboxylase subunit epsilon n=1 Tax=Skermania pinensis TaxID=39122 RepID=A0ABX8SC76_9ACTN|nr:acyl-CoA carboxylase epsilon subunit [Skermania piniformis]QXQ13291.1 acyl-CoA carboxylase subunit epsilon [Skermania piniformis]